MHSLACGIRSKTAFFLKQKLHFLSLMCQGIKIFGRATHSLICVLLPLFGHVAHSLIEVVSHTNDLPSFSRLARSLVAYLL